MQPIIGELLHEEFWVLYLNNSNKVIYKAQLSKGGMLGTIVGYSDGFEIAFETNAHSLFLLIIILLGKLLASDFDLKLTKKIIAGKAVEKEMF